MPPASSAKTWITGAVAAVVGVLIALRGSPSPPASGTPATTGAHAVHDGRGPAPRAPAVGPELEVAATPSGDARSPALEQRLRAAMTVMTVPASPPADQTATPFRVAPVSPEQETQRRIALIGWAAEAQRMLDDCVARPEPQRRPVELDVLFAPLAGAGDPMAAVAISVPVQELRRLWHDTDPDALQGCMDQIRSLGLVVPPVGAAPVLPLSASAESVLVTL